jgi:hypothetical protein
MQDLAALLLLAGRPTPMKSKCTDVGYTLKKQKASSICAVLASDFVAGVSLGSHPIADRQQPLGH